jgi:surface carbohydrate biosynthesis protein
MLKKILRLSTYFFKCKFSFRYPTNKAVLLVHKEGLELLAHFVESTSISVANVERPNVFVLLRMLLHAKKGLVGYLNANISLVNPKVVLTFIDNDISFYRLMERFPQVAFVSIQNGLRNDFARADNFGFLSQLDAVSKGERLSATTICSFGDATGEQYLRYINAKTNTIGSLKNNLYESHSKEKQFDITFISQHPPSSIRDEPGRVYFGHNSVPFESYYKIEFEVVRFLGDYCRQHNLRLAVSGKRDNGFGTEKEFFLSALGPNSAEFIPRDSNFSTYDTLSATGVIVTIDSTVGYEFLSRGQRVAFFSSRINSANSNLASTIRDTNFGFPLELGDSGPFWSNTGGVLEYERILDHLRAVGDEEWATEIAPYNEILMAYQPGSPVFKKLLLELGLTLIDGVKSDA